MARTTVEDCMQQCDNRFNLAYHVSLRARDIQRKGDQRVDMRDDKALVVALREIKDGLTNVPALNAPPEEFLPMAAAPAAAQQTPANETIGDAAPDIAPAPVDEPAAELDTAPAPAPESESENKPAADAGFAFNFGSDSASAQQTPQPDDSKNIGGGGESQ